MNNKVAGQLAANQLIIFRDNLTATLINIIKTLAVSIKLTNIGGYK
jgi:hypothetical protein